MNLGDIGERFGVSFPAESLDMLTLGAFQQAVEDAKTEARFEPGPFSLEGELNEHHGYLTLYRKTPDQDANLWAGSALLMLSLMHRRCRDWRGDVGWDYATDGQGSDHLPIEVYLGHMNQAIGEGWTVTQWMSSSHQRHLWLRHRRVVLQKMVSRREDPSLFTWDENRFYGVRKDQPKDNGPRFQNALQIMEDLQLIRLEDQGRRSYSLLPEGADLLERFRSYTVPQPS